MRKELKGSLTKHSEDWNLFMLMPCLETQNRENSSLVGRTSHRKSFIVDNSDNSKLVRSDSQRVLLIRVANSTPWEFDRVFIDGRLVFRSVSFHTSLANLFRIALQFEYNNPITSNLKWFMYSYVYVSHSYHIHLIKRSIHYGRINSKISLFVLTCFRYMSLNSILQR